MSCVQSVKMGWILYILLYAKYACYLFIKYSKENITLKRLSSVEESTMIKEVHKHYFKYYYWTYKCTDQIMTA